MCMTWLSARGSSQAIRPCLRLPPPAFSGHHSEQPIRRHCRHKPGTPLKREPVPRVSSPNKYRQACRSLRVASCFVTEPWITLEVETPNGVYLRRIRPATVLPAGIPSGPAAEDATRNAAAYWGLPDFVFRPAQRSRGSASREVGDAILLVGTVGASVQVKARHSHTPNDMRERSWLDKSIRKAAKQAAGTIRSITSGLDCALVNERGRRVLIKGREKTWAPHNSLGSSWCRRVCAVWPVGRHPSSGLGVPIRTAQVYLRRHGISPSRQQPRSGTAWP
jgi:hypothetical protein